MNADHDQHQAEITSFELSERELETLAGAIGITVARGGSCGLIGGRLACPF